MRFGVGLFAAPVRGRGVSELAHSGLDDGPVSGAAAQIARQGTEYLFAVGRVAIQIQGEQRHDEAGRAESALRAMMIHQRLLYRMGGAVVGLSQALDGDQLLAVEGRQEADAGVHRPIAYAAPVGGQFADDHGARAAVPFGAAFLRPAPARDVAQIFQHGHRRRGFMEGDDCAV